MQLGFLAFYFSLGAATAAVYAHDQDYRGSCPRVKTIWSTRTIHENHWYKTRTVTATRVVTVKIPGDKVTTTVRVPTTIISVQPTTVTLTTTAEPTAPACVPGITNAGNENPTSDQWILWNGSPMGNTPENSVSFTNVVDTLAHGESRSLKFSVPDSAILASQVGGRKVITVCPGSLHRISVWIRRPSLETGCKMSLRVDNGVLLDVDSDITLTTTDWFSISGTFTPAAGSGPTQNVNLEMNCVSLVSANVGASRVMYADDLTVVVLESSLPA